MTFRLNSKHNFGMGPIPCLTTACVAKIRWQGFVTTEKCSLGRPAVTTSFTSRPSDDATYPSPSCGLIQHAPNVRVTDKRMRFGLLPAQFIVGLSLPLNFVLRCQRGTLLALLLVNFICGCDQPTRNVSGLVGGEKEARQRFWHYEQDSSLVCTFS